MNTDNKGMILFITLAVGAPTFYLSTIDYSFLWRYVGWTNQFVATVMLWTAAIYLLKQHKFHWIAGVPAIFMTAVVCTYIFYAPEGLQLPYNTSMIIGLILTGIVLLWYAWMIIKHKQSITANQQSTVA